MQLVLPLVGDVGAHVQRVVASMLAVARADAGNGGTKVGTRTAEVDLFLRELVEGRLKLFGLAAQHNQVAAGAVNVGQARTVLFPNVANGAQLSGVVEETTRRVKTHGVELGQMRILVSQLAVAADDASAVALNADDAAVLPVTLLGFVGELELVQQVVGHLVLRSCGLDLLDEAGPRTLLEFVKQRSISVFSHNAPFSQFVYLT